MLTLAIHIRLQSETDRELEIVNFADQGRSSYIQKMIVVELQDKNYVSKRV